MILAVDAGSPVPVYEQVRQQVTRMALAGTLAPGQRLPTIRQLASDLGLAKGTVARAYELLEADRVIETQGRKGSFVTEPPVPAAPPRAGTDQAADLAQAADSLAVVARQLGLDRDSAHRAIDEAWDRF